MSLPETATSNREDFKDRQETAAGSSWSLRSSRFHQKSFDLDRGEVGLLELRIHSREIDALE
jgi:hypothetical protein